jgi:hypothetical protein
VLGAVLFIFATLVPRREVIAAGRATKLAPAE